MITPPNDYPSRTHTWAAGDPVASADLNAIQDGLVALSDSVDELAADKAEARTCTGNQADSPAPDRGGAVEIWVEKATNGTTEVVLDTFVDWRQRYILVQCYTDSSGGDEIAGGSLDGQIDKNLSLSDVGGRLFFSQDGHAGSTNTPGLYVTITTDVLRIYARSSDGALCMKKSANADPNLHVVGLIKGSPRQNH